MKFKLVKISISIVSGFIIGLAVNSYNKTYSEIKKQFHSKK